MSRRLVFPNHVNPKERPIVQFRTRKSILAGCRDWFLLIKLTKKKGLLSKTKWQQALFFSQRFSVAAPTPTLHIIQVRFVLPPPQHAALCGRLWPMSRAKHKDFLQGHPAWGHDRANRPFRPKVAINHNRPGRAKGRNLFSIFLEKRFDFSEKA